MQNTFHKKVKSFTLSQLAEGLGISYSGKNIEIKAITALDVAKKGDLSFLDNPKYISQVKETKASAVIISESNAQYLPANVVALVAKNPHASYAKALAMFFPSDIENAQISPQACIDESAEIGEGCNIAAFAVVSKGAKVRANVSLGSNCFIGENVEIGKGCKIAANVVITCSKLGERVIVHPGASIGQDGFGFAMDSTANGLNIVKVPQIGSVQIGDDVEIGSNTTIDRGSLGHTIIGNGTKIDNLVQVAHNVKIGKNCQIVAQTGIAGSTTLGDGIVVGGQAGFTGHINVADGTIVAARSGVTKNITEAGQVLAGFPAMPMERWKKLQIAMHKLLPQKSKITKSSEAMANIDPKSINVEDLIPHRSPMLLVDNVLEVMPNESITCRKTFKAEDPIFAGHFPGHPVLPGVLAIEALAQTGAVLVNISLNKKAEETLFFFMSVEGSKFRLPVAPGDVLDLHVKMVKRRGDVFRFEGKVMLKGKVAAEANFTAKLEEIA